MCPPGRLRSISIAARIIPTLVNGHTGLRHSAQCSCCNSPFRQRPQAYGCCNSPFRQRPQAYGCCNSPFRQRPQAYGCCNSPFRQRPQAVFDRAAKVDSSIVSRLCTVLLQSIQSSSRGCPQSCCNNFRRLLKADQRTAAVDSVIV